MFFFCRTYIALIILWGLNGLVQSLVWSPILRIAGDYFDKNDREKFGTDISTTVTLGTLASYGVGLLTMMFLPWNYVFLKKPCSVTIMLMKILFALGITELLLHQII